MKYSLKFMNDKFVDKEPLFSLIMNIDKECFFSIIWQLNILNYDIKYEMKMIQTFYKNQSLYFSSQVLFKKYFRVHKTLNAFLKLNANKLYYYSIKCLLIVHLNKVYCCGVITRNNHCAIFWKKTNFLKKNKNINNVHLVDKLQNRPKNKQSRVKWLRTNV